ncbi:MAG: hypothetical protein PHI16_01540 [Methanocellales archaeon]|nr:hypothetical protein [Methanocellales archaeon]
MLIKAGVDISRLTRETRKALSFCDRLLSSFNYELIITSTYEGNHSAGSLHYCNQAFDFRKPPDHIHEIVIALKEMLGPDYDIIVEKDHIHIEYDPKG